MVFAFEAFELDPQRYELRKRGVVQHLEPQVFDVLAYLVANHDRVVTKDELLERVWGDRFVSDAALSSRLMAARRAVDDSGREQRLIRTVHARGFRFVGAVTELAEAAPPAPEVRRVPAAPGPLRPVTPAPRGRPIGREAELDRLWEGLEAALGGRRTTMFVTGEAGIGKTTLVEAFLAEADAKHDLWAGRGQCLEHRGAGEAYMPVLEALGELSRGRDGGAVLNVLMRHAPTWVAQMPWALSDEQLDVVQRRTVGATRERMLREAAEALEALASERLVVLVLEDLHWSDYSTLDLVAWLARRPAPTRLLVIGTYRPADVRAGHHPLADLHGELRARGGCEEIALPFLSEAAVEEYLGERFPGGAVPASAARALHRRTEGNPLFMGNVVAAWLERGMLEQGPVEWRAAVPVGELEQAVPQTLRSLLEQELERLVPEDRAVLEAASAAGMEFSAAVLAAALEVPDEEAEARCANLARKGKYLGALGAADWPDGTTTPTFGFVHSLYREVFHAQLTPAHRSRLHRLIGERLERAHGASRMVPATELAAHFLEGRDHERAVRYLQLAAEQALERSAQQDALHHLTAALELLRRMPESPERARAELAVQTTLAPALIATKGWAAPEVEQAYVRAQELAGQLGDVPQVSSLVSYGLATLHEYRGEYDLSQARLEQHLQQYAADLTAEARELLACSTFHQGKFEAALEHADRGLAVYAPEQVSLPLSRFGESPGVGYNDWAALALWFLGYPDRALDRAHEALRLAEWHWYSLTTAQAQMAFLRQHRREPEATRDWADETIRVASEQGFPFRTAQATVLRGWAVAALGASEDGLAELRAGLAAYEAFGAAMDLPYYLGLLAEVCGLTGRTPEGLELLARALAMVLANRPFFYEAELHRLRGRLLLEAEGPEGAEASFREALLVARRQRARSLELRAAMDLAVLWEERGDRTGAHALLASLVSRLTEGLDTPDLKDARALEKRLR